MATSSYVNSLLGSLAAPIKVALSQAFSYLLTNLTFGRAEPGQTLQARGANLRIYPLSATTHGLPSAPYLLVPVAPLDTVGASIVPLTVTRAADASRIYLSSSATNATVFVFVEG